jgi:hypothetical protein
MPTLANAMPPDLRKNLRFMIQAFQNIFTPRRKAYAKTQRSKRKKVFDLVFAPLRKLCAFA